MHSAPSVSYPVGRSAFVAWLYAALVLVALLALLAWVAQSSLGWRQWIALAAVLASGSIAAQDWRGSPTGVLRWDGVGWSWEEGGAAAPGQAEIAMDLQSRLLVRWRPESGRVLWLWLERGSDVSHWDALRRAVYSRASTHVRAAGKPPAA
jgi:toxin CptA